MPSICSKTHKLSSYKESILLSATHLTELQNKQQEYIWELCEAPTTHVSLLQRLAVTSPKERGNSEVRSLCGCASKSTPLVRRILVQTVCEDGSQLLKFQQLALEEMPKWHFPFKKWLPSLLLLVLPFYAGCPCSRKERFLIAVWLRVTTMTPTRVCRRSGADRPTIGWKPPKKRGKCSENIINLLQLGGKKLHSTGRDTKWDNI